MAELMTICTLHQSQIEDMKKVQVEIWKKEFICWYLKTIEFYCCWFFTSNRFSVWRLWITKSFINSKNIRRKWMIILDLQSEFSLILSKLSFWMRWAFHL
jgi:hypothetical protein